MSEALAILGLLAVLVLGLAGASVLFMLGPGVGGSDDEAVPPPPGEK